MTLLERCLAMLVRYCEAGQKEAAWSEAKLLAGIYPAELHSLPNLLKDTMLKKVAK